MNYQTISDVYAENDRIRERLKAAVSNLSDEQSGFLPEDEKWTVAEVVEHLAMVEEGAVKISAKLLGKAQARGAAAADGKIKFSDSFREKLAGASAAKFEAPEFVRPTGSRRIAESLARMDETRQKLNDLRPLFETVDCTDFKFPHPAFGEISAHEWLALIGGHEARHLRQIQRILEKMQ